MPSSIVNYSCNTEEVAIKVEPPLKVGQQYGGGVIIFLDSTGKHGIVAGGGGSAPWSNGSNIGVGTDYTDGKANTEKIIAAQGEGNYAAYPCDQSAYNGYSDWYFPSLTESHYLLFLPSPRWGIYWTSTESGPSEAWTQDIGRAIAVTYPRENTISFLGIRKF